MVRKPQDGSLGDASAGLVGRAAIGARRPRRSCCSALALVAEMLRRRHRAPPRARAARPHPPDRRPTAAVVSLLALAGDLHRPTAGRRRRQRARLARSAEHLDDARTGGLAVATPDAVDDRSTPTPTDRADRPGRPHPADHGRRPDARRRQPPPPVDRAGPPSPVPGHRGPAASPSSLRGAARRLPLVDRGTAARPGAPTGARSTPVGVASTTPTAPRSVTTRT